MKKLVVLTFITMLCMACSTEEETVLDETANFDIELENYKGVFTTADGQSRGVLDVTLSEDGLSVSGSLTLDTGEVVILSTDQITDLESRKEITFTSNDLSFTMTTGQEEEVMTIDAVTFRGAESGVLIGQNTERAPIQVVVGTYTCPGCPSPLSNLDGETFNLVITTANGLGQSQVITQTTLGITIYQGLATQTGCTVNGDFTTCNLTSGTNFGVVGEAFNPGGGPVTWSGTHTFNNGPTGPDDCSTISGTWTWSSSSLGTLGGDFTSNSSGNCVI